MKLHVKWPAVFLIGLAEDFVPHVGARLAGEFRTGQNPGTKFQITAGKLNVSMEMESLREPGMPHAGVYVSPSMDTNIQIVKSKGGRTSEENAAMLPALSRVRFFWSKIAACGLVIGAVFGMMGSGGSMILKPMLYYIFEQRPFKLTIYEMYMILAVLAFFGAALGQRKACVHWHHAGIMAVFASGLGMTLGAVAASHVTSHTQLVCFGFLVVSISAHMWCKARGRPAAKSVPAERPGNSWQPHQFVMLVLVATMAGALCGFIGMGGGFILTPLLCHLGHDMESAVSTSLAVIFLSSCAGLQWYGYLDHMSPDRVDAALVASLASVGCLGVLLSDRVAGCMSGPLKLKLFATLLLSIGTTVVVLELVIPMQKRVEMEAPVSFASA